MDREIASLNAKRSHAADGSDRKARALTICGWLIHLYTASGTIAGLFALEYTARHEFRAAFITMAIAIAIDSSDGPLARAVDIRRRIPVFDGAMLDNVVDYLTYVVAPAFLLIEAKLLVPGTAGLAAAAFVMLASAYGFCRVDAKTADHYFRGFPSYWNLVAFYLYYVQLDPALNTAIVAILALMVFLPNRYIYPNRTVPFRRLTLSLAVLWGAATLLMLIGLPQRNALLLYISMAYVAYYFIMSFALSLARNRGI